MAALFSDRYSCIYDLVSGTNDAQWRDIYRRICGLFSGPLGRPAAGQCDADFPGPVRRADVECFLRVPDGVAVRPAPRGGANHGGDRPPPGPRADAPFDAAIGSDER